MQIKSLKILINLFLGIIAIACLISCSTAEKLPTEEHIKMSQPWVFNAGFEKAVYKSSMNIFGNDLSGLTIIKKSGRDYRIVFISELGLKYFDLEFFSANDSVHVHHMISLLDHKPVIDILENNFSLLFLIFPEKTKERFYKDSMLNSMQKEYKSGRKKSLYNYDKNFGSVNTIRQKHKSTKLSITISSNDRFSPEKINFNQKNFSLRFEQIER